MNRLQAFFWAPLMTLLFVVVPGVFIILFLLLGWLLAIASTLAASLGSFISVLLVPLLKLKAWIAITAVAGSFFLAAVSMCFLIIMCILTWYFVKFLFFGSRYLVLRK